MSAMRSATIAIVQRVMSARFLATFALLVCPVAAGADPVRWSAVATPPRSSLPAVSVVLGEPGYISTRNSPIELRAIGGSSPFDGYIGFHFEVAGKKTVDVPVVARAVLRPGQAWSFATWAQVREVAWQKSALDRELVIEWRDRSMRVIARRSTGTPPWNDPRPLRVIRDGEAVSDSCCLGVAAHVRSARNL
ncbi:MAG TPA: hypothetical protein VFL80_11895, partial [Thermoanaerobaculia bacterium]|nr:hypothetical protein [Thermoanaerobaculia bacterium]